MLAEEWEKFSVESRGNLLRTAIDSMYVLRATHRRATHRGPDPDPVGWRGPFERPQRGTTTYKTQPIPWPEGILTLANVPEWAVRVGHPALPEGLRQDIHDEARRQGTYWYLTPEEGGRARD